MNRIRAGLRRAVEAWGRFRAWAWPLLLLAWDRTARRENLPLTPMAGFWLGVLLLELVPSRHHGFRSLVIVLIVVLVIGSLRYGEERHALGRLRGERILLRILAGLAALQFLFALVALWHPDLGPMATTTLSAARILVSGGNPYAEPADPLFEGPLIAEGYKLPPATAVGFLPLGLLFGPRGIVLTNLLVQLGVAALVFAIARGEDKDERHQTDGVLAAILYLALPVVPVELFLDGAPELVAVLGTLAAIFLADRRPFHAGLAAGLSCASGLMPGAAILPLCLPSTTERREGFLMGLLLGLSPILLYFLRGPEPFLLNVFTIGPVGGIRGTGLGPMAAALVETIAGLLWVGLGALAWYRPLELEQRSGLAAVAVLSAVLFLPGGRSAEILWWLPLGAIAVARPGLLMLTRLEEGEAAETREARAGLRLREFVRNALDQARQ
jgi:hypothetical protein